MSKSKLFIAAAIFFAAGILIESSKPLARPALYAALGACAAGFYFAFSVFKKQMAATVLFLLCVLAGGAIRLSFAQAPNEYQQILNSKQQMEGYIVDDVDERASNDMLTFQPKGFSQRILLTTLKDKNYTYGDWVVVTGNIEQPQNFDNFDYQNFLAKNNIYAVMRYPKVLILKTGQQSRFFAAMFSVKHWFISRVTSELPEPAASLMIGILIGARKTLDPAIVQNFNQSGTSHIIAVSGYNISIIAVALGYLTPLLGRRGSLLLSGGVIAGFVVITGASASVLRAAAMGLLLLVARNLGRQYAAAPALFFAALLMLLINPKILFWDIGFQLSFAATLGIVYGMPLLERLTQNWPDFEKLKSIVLITLVATAATLPLILLHFGRLSLVAPVTNLLILPMVPLTMLSGFLIIIPFFGHGFAFISLWLLKYILFVTAFLAHLPYASLSVNISSEWFVAAVCALVLLYAGLKRLTAGKTARVEQNNLA